MKWLKIPTRRRKIWSQNWRNKSRRRQNAVEKSQSRSKKFGAIDVGLWAGRSSWRPSNVVEAPRTETDKAEKKR